MGDFRTVPGMIHSIRCASTLSDMLIILHGHVIVNRDFIIFKEIMSPLFTNVKKYCTIGKMRKLKGGAAFEF